MCTITTCFPFYVLESGIVRSLIIQRSKSTYSGSITDKQNALRHECTFKIEIVLEIGVSGVNIYLKITVLALSHVLARLAQSVRRLVP